MNPVLMILFVLPVFFLPQHALAHGTGHGTLDQTRTRAVEFLYSDDSPMQYAKVLVFSPLDPNIEHQNARTDKNGAFAFVPDSQGQWLIKATDGMGHAEEAVVNVAFGPNTGNLEVDQNHPASSGTSDSQTRALKIIAGLSLIMNAAFGLYMFRSVRTNPAV